MPARIRSGMACQASIGAYRSKDAVGPHPRLAPEQDPHRVAASVSTFPLPTLPPTSLAFRDSVGGRR
jgi:hypothetical protein